MNGLSLLPPIIVLVLALATRRVVFSLIIGLFTASLIAMQFNPLAALQHTVNSISHTLDLPQILQGSFPHDSNWTIFAFIISLGIIITMLQESGATQAFTVLIEKKVKKREDVEKMSLSLSTLFFIDDYFSTLSIGQLMYPITDRYRIARAKLAFLIDSMASPLAVLCPFSSWVGVIIGFLANNGITDDLAKNPSIIAAPFWVFISLIPFIFYSFIIMAASWYIVGRKISFGLMKKREQYALKTGDTQGNKEEASKSPQNKKGSANFKDFFVVWFTLVTALLGSLLYHGGWVVFGGDRSMMEAFHHTEITQALLSCSWLSLSISSLYFLIRGILTPACLPTTILHGSRLMQSALMILIIAWSMGDILRNDLLIGDYIAANLLNHVSPKIFPFAVFFTALFTSFATGSSWGTAALLFPMIIPTLIAYSDGQEMLFLKDVPFFLPTIGALLSGAVAGDHISPTSDTTIMTSVSTNMPHIDHVKTQLCYALPCIAGTSFGYLLFGLLPYSLPVLARGLIALLTGFLVVVVLLESLNKFLSSPALPDSLVKN